MHPAAPLHSAQARAADTSTGQLTPRQDVMSHCHLRSAPAEATPAAAATPAPAAGEPAAAAAPPAAGQGDPFTTAASSLSTGAALTAQVDQVRPSALPLALSQVCESLPLSADCTPPDSSTLQTLAHSTYGAKRGVRV
jgi:hypothetical protein